MPFTPSMKLNTFTKPASQSAMTTAAAIRAAGGRLRWLTSTAPTARLAAHCRASRPRTESPDRSSANPIMLNAATAIAKAAAAAPPMSNAATTSPAATGAPPPRGVGTECEDREFGVSMADTRRSSLMVAGSARATTAPLAPAAIRIVSFSDMSWYRPPRDLMEQSNYSKFSKDYTQ